MIYSLSLFRIRPGERLRKVRENVSSGHWLEPGTLLVCWKMHYIVPICMYLEGCFKMAALRAIS